MSPLSIVSIMRSTSRSVAVNPKSSCVITSATAIGGLLPLAIVIIAGLISSTLLARLVTPVMYLLLADKDPVSA